ncbi:MAG: CpsB/CapC family capsule biosynthesis tyrosine phosphatase [Bacillota bacterium]|nr:CpsB/CapC family capsule biosynthesis tyrosine phosphatase [Bacillota bacterium]
MIDIHCHVLWGIDDGPKTIEESIETCKMLKNKGINTIIATPHYILDSAYQTHGKVVIDMVKQLNDLLREKSLGLEIRHGMEVFLTPELINLINSKEILTLGDTKYILIESSLNNISIYMEDIFYKLQLEGYTPIFAHPERNSKINLDYKLIEKYISNGVLIQVNHDSLIGRYGSTVKHFTIELLKKGLAHFIATDTHYVNERFKGEQEFINDLSNIIGCENAEKLVRSNPMRLLNNQDIEVLEPVGSRRHFLRRLFSF